MLVQQRVLQPNVVLQSIGSPVYPGITFLKPGNAIGYSSQQGSASRMGIQNHIDHFDLWNPFRSGNFSKKTTYYEGKES